MKSILSALLSLILALSFFSCQKEANYIDQSPTESNPLIQEENAKLKKAITTAVRQIYLGGQVLNEAGQPVTGAIVKAGGKEVHTDNNGFYNFRSIISVNRDYVLVTVKKNGYMNGFKTFTPSKKEKISHSMDIVLQEQPAAEIINSTTGGTVTLDEKISLTFPGNSIVTKQGISYNGDVHIVGRYIDPAASNFSEIMPGILTGLNSQEQLRAMISFGMASIDLYDASGNELEIAPDSQVRMEMPATSDSPATIPLWHFNETYGLWIQTGTATKQSDKYIAFVNHFSIWNLDLEENSFELMLQFVAGQNKKPLPSVSVEISNAATGSSIGYFKTDGQGKATLINCPSNAPLKISVRFNCETVEKIIDPVSASREEVVDVTPQATRSLSFNIEGTLYNCDNQILKNHSFEIRLNNGALVNYHLTSDDEGKYKVAVLLCNNTNEISVRAYSYINNELKFSPSETITAGDNIYSPRICHNIPNGNQYNDDDEVVIPDAQLEKAIRNKIGKASGVILHKDVKDVIFLNASLLGVKSLQGLEHFTSLDSLYAYGNVIEDLNPVKSLEQLSCIVVSNNRLDDKAIDILKGLPDLKYISIGLNQITSISQLAGLTELRGLNIDRTKVTDISVIRNFPHLLDLGLSNNNIGDITDAEGLVNLERLWMDSINVEDISVIGNFTKLKVLHASYNKITAIVSLANCDELQHLTLQGNKISNIIPLQDLNFLRGLVIRNNQLTTISPIIKKHSYLIDLTALEGNNIPSSEIDVFKNLNPNCIVR